LPQAVALPCVLTLQMGALFNRILFFHPDDWLTVHRSLTLVNFQIDAQNSFFIYI
jgi:hypothetical protein